jgi:hypothetical protein
MDLLEALANRRGRLEVPAGYPKPGTRYKEKRERTVNYREAQGAERDDGRSAQARDGRDAHTRRAVHRTELAKSRELEAKLREQYTLEGAIEKALKRTLDTGASTSNLSVGAGRWAPVPTPAPTTKSRRVQSDEAHEADIEKRRAKVRRDIRRES